MTKARIIYKPRVSGKSKQPLFAAQVPAGFPSPADDYSQDRLDLNRQLVKNPAATFFVRAAGDSMIGAGIHHDDLLVVDRSLEPKDKNIIIAVINGELTVKRIRIRNKKITLVPENNEYASQQVTPDTQFEIWGVVTNVIHRL
jgi:DNA polymerase V